LIGGSLGGDAAGQEMKGGSQRDHCESLSHERLLPEGQPAF
jgi:hypothetical protein